jgi:hypothetical protein
MIAENSEESLNRLLSTDLGFGMLAWLSKRTPPSSTVESDRSRRESLERAGRFVAGDPEVGSSVGSIDARSCLTP